MAGYITDGSRKRAYYEDYIANLCGEYNKGPNNKGPYKRLINKLTISDMQYLIHMVEEAQARAIGEACKTIRTMRNMEETL
ncbi:MAG TPA: hypothetical protein VFD33_02410 [Bacillota bacterium]|nr:hypothetical protein [Bacillota bacterium]